MTQTVAEQNVVDTPSAPKPASNYFQELAAVDVQHLVGKKNGYTYLSWADAVDQLKRKHPDAKIITKRFPEADENGNMRMVPYLRTNQGFFVEVEVIVNGNSVEEVFPITDHKNNPIGNPTTKNINDSIQRAKAKAIAGHGLGLYIYQGEDFPIDDTRTPNPAPVSQQRTSNPQYPNRNPVQQQNRNTHSLPPQNQQPPQPNLNGPMTEQQKGKLRELATNIAALRLGNGATHDAMIKAMGDIYGEYKVTGDLTFQLANQKINEMLQQVKAIHEQRVQHPQMIQTPGDDLSQVI
ncbi:DUF1071 domain-containing protein [Cytobacillus oceanisediminis]|uniref:Sak single strand annealing protein n=1 Tax=Cytobacillus oceanisediminis TaxID=665099 RepID=UPI001FB5459E|nr:DUF1071 domain-containing protein [Cytobacillus oceanisediminis]UOE58181.1 DUF1071 domain-containing protein [Cytobacillus oceanisediminis]